MCARHAKPAAQRAAVTPEPWPLITSGVSLAYIAMVLWVIASRIAHPYELEFIEGAILDQALRLRHGLALYAAPSLEYVPLNYTPLYSWLGALATAALGESFFALRLVSAASAALACTLMWKLVHLETGRARYAWLALGLFAALFRLGGAWLDVARADSLQLALLLSFAWVVRVDRSPWRMPLLAGAVLALAFLAKQSALPAAAPLVLWCLVREPRRGAVLAVAAVGLIAAAIALLDAGSGGWFGYYAFTVPGFHPLDSRLLFRFPVRDLLLPLWPLLLLAPLAALRRDRPHPSGTAGFHGALLTGFAGTAWLLRAYPGAYDNVLMPAHAAFAMLGALVFARATAAAMAGSRGRFVSRAACGLVLVQLVLLRWNPVRQVPAPGDHAAGDRLVEELRECHWHIFVPTHPYLAVRAGQPARAHIQPIMDIIRDGHGPRETRLRTMLRDSLRAHAWDAIVLDSRDWLIEAADSAGYKPVSTAFTTADDFWLVTGMHTRPEWISLSPEAAAAADLPR